jgi:hypothetical protein
VFTPRRLCVLVTGFPASALADTAAFIVIPVAIVVLRSQKDVKIESVYVSTSCVRSRARGSSSCVVATRAAGGVCRCVGWDAIGV